VSESAPDNFRILVVEDDPRMRRVLELLLGDRWTVQVAEDGQSAFDLALQQPPDLVVADLLMPGVDGIQLVRRLRANPPTASVPVIMVSGVTEEDRRLEALAAGASDFLVKPFAEKELVARMAAQLELASQRRMESEARLRAILDGALDAVITIDAEGNIRYWNPQAERTFGWTRDEALGRELAELVIPEAHRGTHREGLRRLARGGTGRVLNRRVELEGVRRNGELFPIELTVTSVSGYGGVVYNAFVADITERRRAEQERERLLTVAEQARHEAEGANRAKDHFMATLSHELRTPLNAIIGWAHLLRSSGWAADLLPRGMDVIERNARMQGQLINDMLEITRIVQGKLRLEVRGVDPRKIAQAVLETVRPAAESKQIRLEAELGEVPTLMADPDRIQQVLWNLLSNAIKFTPKGGSVRLVAESGGSHVRFEVRDTGPGISRQFLPHVFQPFTQDTSSPRAHGGLGLGLAIARHLIELHGGAISVDSETGRGTTFTVRLPCTAEAAAALPRTSTPRPSAPHAPAPESTPLPRLDGIDVLVVDDECDSCDVIVATLESRGATARAVHSVADAMAAIAARKPHVVLSDIAMPGEDGYDLIRQVRALPQDAGGLLPVAALTAYAGTAERIRALTAGFHLHVAKPVEPHELVTVVASLAGRSADPQLRDGE
jgi:PAS domain S-box-containing protein